MIALLVLTAATALPAASGPDRLFQCDLGRVTNMAAATPAELGLSGSHAVTVLQPDGAVEYVEKPPRPLGSAALVRVADPDGVLATTAVGTVFDDWPRKVEFLSSLPDGRKTFVSFAGIDPAGGTATGSAGILDKDGETLVAGQFLQGRCTVTVARNLAAQFARQGARSKEKRP